MTFAQSEESAARGNIIQCFRFVYGPAPGEYFAYTTRNESITLNHGAPVGVITYEPVPISRGNIVSNGTLDKSAIKISTDVATGLAELFRVYPPSSVVVLTIYEGHIDDPDDQFLVVWAGRIVQASREGSTQNFSGEPVSTQLKRPGLRRHYQYGCPLPLYGIDCGANKAAATRASTVTVIDGTVVTVSPGWEGAFNPVKFIRGTFEWTPAGKSTQKRTILRISGNVISLSGVATDLDPGDDVDIVLGCNHRAYAETDGDCEVLHNRINAYGGQLWIPQKNVINKNPYY